MMKPDDHISVPALELIQGEGQILYTFVVDGKVLPQFAAISRVKREGDLSVRGYQRPEVNSHVNEIRRYIESESPMIPNAIVMAVDERVRFSPLKTKKCAGQNARHGTLEIPIFPEDSEEDKPAWVVDGQQRMAAIREAKIKSFPICVIAFPGSDDRKQREQFMLVNSTKPLPKSLLYELLPDTESRLPSLLQRRRFPAKLLRRLNLDEDSPLQGMIKTTTCPEGLIKDNSILKMIENSMSDGLLYRYREIGQEDGDAEKMLKALKRYWSAVAETFPEAWGQLPRRSRLMHGAGIVSMGFVMDAIADRYRKNQIPSQVQFEAELDPLKSLCRWTEGFWDLGADHERKWNEIQNTHRDIQLLTNHLLFRLRKARTQNLPLNGARK